MKASRSCSGISKAASRSGAGHPPVRSARRRASAPVKPVTRNPSKKPANSLTWKRNVSARTSTSSPHARSRGTPNAGSERLATTSWTRAGR